MEHTAASDLGEGCASYLACWIRRRGRNSEGRRGWQGQRGRGLGSRTDEAARPARAPVEGSLARGAGWERACGRPPPCRSRPPPCAGAALPRSRRPASSGPAVALAVADGGLASGQSRRRGLADSRSLAVARRRLRSTDSRDADAGCGPTAADEGLRGEGSYFRQYILGFLSWAFSGLHIRAPMEYPRVKNRVRPKPAEFRVSEPANPWAKNRHQNRDPRTRNPRISAPNPIRCHF